MYLHKIEKKGKNVKDCDVSDETSGKVESGRRKPTNNEYKASENSKMDVEVEESRIESAEKAVAELESVDRGADYHTKKSQNKHFTSVQKVMQLESELASKMKQSKI
eukprot:TRINITY_DN33370_c0_g1_i1.p2 TRINITY_DN33370_c0_g1~~TRINITY_DN33370_c0_g1_i1.p2  ORF type:complete len:107 (-),score=37.73 TRINITY_DN33370_c0_g1_i1:3-323(-)